MEQALGLADRSPSRPPFPFITGFEGTYIFGSGRDVLDTTEHATRFRWDFAQLVADGITSFRACIPWHHIERNRGVYDWSWTDTYLACAREFGLAPIADPLHHTSFPDWLAGGFADEAFVPSYLAFVEAFARRYPFVRRFTIINEPYVTAWFCGSVGIWHPHREGPHHFVPMLRNVARAICEATERLDRMVDKAEFIHTESCEMHVALDPESEAHAAHANHLRFSLLDLALGRIGADHPLNGFMTGHGVTQADLAWFAEHPARIDVLGLDYYSHSELAWAKDGRRTRHEVKGFAAIALDYAERYRCPVMLGETNLRASIDSRVSWLKHMVEQCETLQERLKPLGLPFLGFCWYPYIDSTDWDSLVREARRNIDPQGIYSLDPAFDRQPSELSRIYAALAKGEITAAEIPPRPFDDYALNERGVRNYLPKMPWLSAERRTG